MYTFSNKLRNLAFTFMVIGLAGLVYGFLSAPKTVEEAKAMVATEHHGVGHGEEQASDHAAPVHAETAHDTHQDEGNGEAAHGEEHDASHDEHLLHQLQNKPWAALYVAAFFLLYDCIRNPCILCDKPCSTSRMVPSTL